MHQYQKKFIRLIEELSYCKRPAEVMDDFLSMGAIALANQIYQSEKMEKKYLEIVGKYSQTDAAKFSEMLAQVVQGLEHCPKDFLGEVYMEIGSSSKPNGQFFTPYSICEISSRIACEDIKQIIQEKGYITGYEPACGAGIMLIALRNLLQKHGYGTNHAFFVAIDCDRSCFNMSYIQLSLLGIAAVVHWGNSLSNEIWDSLYTVPYFLSKFPEIHRLEQLVHKFQSFTPTSTSEPISSSTSTIQPDFDFRQLSLFDL